MLRIRGGVRIYIAISGTRRTYFSVTGYPAATSRLCGPSNLQNAIACTKKSDADITYHVREFGETLSDDFFSNSV